MRILAALILSIDTGDSMIFWGTLLAATTTSCPKMFVGLNSTCTFSAAPETVTSCNSYPTDEINSVTGSFFTVNLKFPLSSLKVPMSSPLTITETAPDPSLVLLFLTLPLIVTLCAMAPTVMILANKNVTKKLVTFLI